MKRKFGKALRGLKDTYPRPDPARKADFLESLPQPEKRKRILPLLYTGRKPFWYAVPAVVTAVLMLTVGIGVYQKSYQTKLPTAEPPAETEPVSTQPSAQTEPLPETAAYPETTVTEPPQTTIREAEETSVIASESTAAAASDASMTTQTTEQTVTEAAYTEHTETVAQATNETSVPETTAVTTVRPSAKTQTAPVITAHTETSRSTETVTTAAEDHYESIPSASEPEAPEPAVTTTTALYSEPNFSTTTSSEAPSADPAPLTGADRTVQPGICYTLTGRLVMESDASDSLPEPLDNDPNGEKNDTWKTMTVDSDLIAIGTVKALYYTSLDDAPWTQIDITLDDVLRSDGTAAARDSISVYVPGGYVPFAEYTAGWDESRIICSFPDLTEAEYANAMVDVNGAYPVRTGEVYLFFLKIPEYESIPAGAYVCTGDAQASHWHLTGLAYRREDTGETVTYRELLAYLNQINMEG